VDGASSSVQLVDNAVREIAKGFAQLVLDPPVSAPVVGNARATGARPAYFRVRGGNVREEARSPERRRSSSAKLIMIDSNRLARHGHLTDRGQLPDFCWSVGLSIASRWG
jgi:hypothetical protein